MPTYEYTITNNVNRSARATYNDAIIASTSSFAYADASTTPTSRWGEILIFDALAIPHGETVTSATLETILTSPGNDDDPEIDIHVEASDDANYTYAFDERVWLRPRTTAFTTWSATAVPSPFTTANFAGAMQEWIDRPGRSEVSARCGILLLGRGDANSTFRFRAENGTPAAKLVIVTSTGGSPSGLLRRRQSIARSNRILGAN